MMFDGSPACGMGPSLAGLLTVQREEVQPEPLLQVVAAALGGIS